MASVAKNYRAHVDLFLGWACAHRAGSVFISSPEQVEANGWTGDVEIVTAPVAPAVAAPPVPESK